MVAVREIGSSEREYWNTEIEKFDVAHPLNAFEWGEVRAVDRWTPIYLVAEEGGEFLGSMMILAKRLVATPFSIFYAQKGPVWHRHDGETLRALMVRVAEIARERNAIFMRISPNISESSMDELNSTLGVLGFKHLANRWSFWNSPRDVSRIDLSKFKKPAEYFNALDRKARASIRNAEKAGVVVEVARSEEELRMFYEMFKEFSVNKGFMARDFEYQQKLWETFIRHGRGKLFLARRGDVVLGGLLVICFAKKVLAMHMVTQREYQKLQTSYAYLWASVKWAIENGYTWWSFRSVGSTPSQALFKSQFKPEIVNLVGYYDLPFKKNLYRLFHFGEFTLFHKSLPWLMAMRKVFHRPNQTFKGGAGTR